MKYQLAIVHRVCPVLAKTAAVYSDKLAMVEATTDSLAKALLGVRTRLIVLLDGCGDEYAHLFDRFFANGQVPGVDYERIATDAIGNHATYRRQLELLSESAQEARFLYFSEDDYIYETGAFRAMMAFLEEPGVDFVTPLDHPDSYAKDNPNVAESIIRCSQDCHWRSVASTCCTFMLKSETLARARKSLSYYAEGGTDFVMGELLTKRDVYSARKVLGGALRYVLTRRNWMTAIPAYSWLKLGLRLPLAPRFTIWSPMPTLAVHLCKPSLPPHYAKLCD